MNRKNLNYGHMQRCEAIAAGFVEPMIVDSPEVKQFVSPSDAFLKLVYSLDPISKLPTGDLSYMVSDKANPEVKAWVLQNIQLDTSSAANLTAPKGLSDDDLIELTRKQGESVDAYAERVNIFMCNNKRIVDDAVNRAQRDVSAKSETPSVSTE